MPRVKRQSREPTHNWHEIAHLCLFPEQRRDERFCPSSLFQMPVSVRATETGIPARTLRHGLARFEALGMR
jgi:hypothetical protein